MDGAANGNCLAESVRAWVVGRKDELGSIELKLVDACNSSISLEINGRLLQVVIPSSLHPAGCNSSEQTDSDEVFLVTTLESNPDEAFQSTVNALNEKLERIRVKPAALGEALDHLLLALQKFEAKKSNSFRNSRCLNHESSAKENRAGQREDIYKMPGSDNGEEEDAESEDFYSDDLGGDESPDHFGYDLAEGESSTRHCNVELLSKCFLFKLAEDAKLTCEAVKKNTDWPNSRTPAGDTDSFNSILQWCSVNPDPENFRIQFHIELAGILDDDRAAVALGFTMSSPVKVVLGFSDILWSLVDDPTSTAVFEPISVRVRQESAYTSQVRSLKKELDDDLDAESQKLRKIDQAHLYGMEVLLPELVHTYFDFLRNNGVARNGKLDNSEMLLELQHATSLDNLFIGLLCFIGARLRALPNWCVVCWNLLPYSVWRLRTCDSEFCLYRFEELGLGATVLHEVQNSPSLIDFELSLARVAAWSSRDVFEPFPAFLLEREEIRGRSGWFSKKERVENHFLPQSSTLAQAVGQTRVRSHSRSGRTLVDIKAKEAQRGNKNLKLLRDILNCYPSVEKMKLCSDEVDLKKSLTKFWHKNVEADTHNSKGKRPEESESSSDWKKKLWLPYDILRFILSTNRLSLHLLEESERLNIEHTVYQFAVLHDNPEKEAYFESRRRDQGGSFFAFHGSASGNWFSILRNGLRCLSNTAYMSSGAAYGAGIYLAGDMSISLRYCTSEGPGWSHGLLKDGFSVLSICEVVRGSCHSSRDIMVVPPEHEKDVAIRYILVFKGMLRHDQDYEVIMGSTLSKHTNLMQHYSNMRALYLAKQQEERYVRKGAHCKALFASRMVEEQITNQISRVGDVNAAGSGFTEQTVVEREISQNVKRGHGSDSGGLGPSALRAVLKEYRNIVKLINVSHEETVKDQNNPPILAGVKVCIPDESNICRWCATLSKGLFKDWPLYKDLEECARQLKVQEVQIKLEFIFPVTYPFAPPFARVVSPRFAFHTGHVTVGGSICMELLTESGWSPAYSFESVIVQIVNAMIEGGGRLDKAALNSLTEYTEHEARDAFDRVARAHGWKKD